jgi:hypothetical protein
MTTESPFSKTLPTFQIAWDNTSISILKECPKKYELAIIHGWRPKTAAMTLLFGGAYHDCIETYETLRASGASAEQALSAAIRLAYQLTDTWGTTGQEIPDPARTRLTLLRALVWYSEDYTHDVLKLHIMPDGRPGLEVSFRFELPFTIPGQPTLLYCGHIDKLAEYSGQLYAVERKTTKSTLSQHFFQRYFFSAQVTGYVYAGKVVLHEPVVGAIIDAMQTGVNFSRFSRAVVNRVNDHLEEWMHDLRWWIEQAHRYAAANYWPHNTESCSKYSGCQFRSVCMKAPHVRQLVLDTEFVQQRWNPLQNRGGDE